MTRLLAAILVIVFYSGCRAPTPTMSDFAPFGSTTVAPPPTGAIGSAGTYYPSAPSPAAPAANPTSPGGSAGAPVSTPTAPPRSQVLPPTGVLGSSETPSAGGTSLNWRESGVAQASYQAPVNDLPAQISANQVLPPDLHPLPAGGAPYSMRGMSDGRRPGFDNGASSGSSTMSTNPGLVQSTTGTRTSSLLRILNRSDGRATNSAANTAGGSTPSQGWQRR